MDCSKQWGNLATSSITWMTFNHGPPDSITCKRNLETFIQLCKELGVPLATEKFEDLSTTLTSLGIILDTEKMEMTLPDKKLKHIKVILQAWLE